MSERDQYLATTEWLAANLDRPELRVLDCTVFLRPREDGGPGYAVVSGREEWQAAHIPGSGFADLPNDLSDRQHPLRFMMPSAEQFAAAMGGYGVGDDSEVVLYDRAGNMWAARIWWMLRAFGFDNARILDGGWQAWSDEGRPVAAKPVLSPRGPLHSTAAARAHRHQRRRSRRHGRRPGLHRERAQCRAASRRRRTLRAARPHHRQRERSRPWAPPASSTRRPSATTTSAKSDAVSKPRAHAPISA